MVFPPDITELGETGQSYVGLDGVLGCPDTGSGSPLPGEEVLTGLLEHGGLQTEDIRILGSEAAAGVLNHIQGISLGLLQIGVVQGTGYTGLGQINLGKETFGGIAFSRVITMYS